MLMKTKAAILSSPRRETKASSVTVESLLPAIRAMVAEELVLRRGYSRKVVADKLRLTPAAISQYLNKVRAQSVAGKIRGSDQLMAVISRLANSVSSPDSDIETIGYPMLLEAASRLTELFEAEKTGKGKSPRLNSVPDIDILNEQIELEQNDASKFLELATRTKNQMAKAFYRQIASDSVRHAELLSEVVSYLEKPKIGRPEDNTVEQSAEELAALIEDEEVHVREALDTLKNTKDPVVQLVLASIQMDEDKHERLLQRLIDLKKSQLSKGR